MAGATDCRTQLASLAIEELDKGDFQMATKILTTSIRLEPNNHELYFERSICHHKLGNFQASLDDANAAIRLNSTDYNIHYQKGLALIGLSMFPEAVTSFKKAIELRAKQDDSKLSDIFKLLRDATNELNSARRRPGLNSAHQTRGESSSVSINQSPSVIECGRALSNDPVDSTTDRLTTKPSPMNRQAVISMDRSINPANGTLVLPNRNSQIEVTNCNPSIMTPSGMNKVSSTASLHAGANLIHPLNVSPDITSIHVDQNCETSGSDQASKSHSQFEWNIRRSERIFLHNSSDQGTSSPQFAVITNPNGTTTTIAHSRQKTNSNHSSISSRSGPIKRTINNAFNHPTYQPSSRSRGPTDSHGDSDVDVDDSCGTQNYESSQCASNGSATQRKRVMVAPSSSMPATSQNSANISANKDDSYSSKYKRLRRDRERARRGTSKLCTIKPSDLEELRKSASNCERRSMRVIAPIDGWLYSGQLSVDDKEIDVPQYVVKLDGDSTGSSYLFTQDTVLNDVIKEVRVKSVSELRKGARICCYWSRTYKCLSTGVVTSRTFEATKSLVSVKYDNGDLSALPLEDLRLLPPDYPKYMSNCDPLLLAKNNDGENVSKSESHNGVNRVTTDNKSSCHLEISRGSDEIHNQTLSSISKPECPDNTQTLGESAQSPAETILTDYQNDNSGPFVQQEDSEVLLDHEKDVEGDDDDATIPPTNETIEFFTGGGITESPRDNEDNQVSERKRLTVVTKESISMVKGKQLANCSRDSSEENNFNIEYRPWMFEGPPKRNKRHGRTYRDNYSAIRRGTEVIRVGDSAELMPRDESILPFIAKIDGLWATSRGEMRVRVRWYYRLIETEGEPYDLKDGQNALFETDHFDENDVQSIFRSTKIISWTEYNREHTGHVNKNDEKTPKIFYLAGYYDPVRRIKHLRSDVKEAAEWTQS